MSFLRGHFVYYRLLTLKSFGLPEGLAQSIAGWDKAASHGALFDDSRQLSTLIGRTTTPMPVAVSNSLETQKKV